MAIQTYTPSQEYTKTMVDFGADILLLGRPGTGKTELLKDICEEQKAAGKKVLVTASTGLAASNLEGGRTIHSALCWNPNAESSMIDRCAEVLEKTDLLVVDEVSMLGRSIIDHLANGLLHAKKRPQLLLSGDFFQLPPVTPGGHQRQYPFENPNWSMLGLMPCFLKEVVRQKDPEFKRMLELAMIGDASCIPYFNHCTQPKLIEGAITLCTRNDFADDINRKKMKLLPGAAVIYDAQGDVDKADFEKTRVEKCLVLKMHMRVMALRNDSSGRYQNGSLGTVTCLKENAVCVRFDHGGEVWIERVGYEVDAKKHASKGVGNGTEKEAGKEEKEVLIEQFPLRGGYAISIHKSQGQTFDAVNIKAPDCWDPGQLYVALSRARTIQGIHLMEPIKTSSLKTDPRVLRFYQDFGAEFAA